MIKIDDGVPLPEPSKPDTWVTGPQTSNVVKYEGRETIPVDPPTCPVCDFGHYFGHCSQCGHTDKPKAKAKHVEQPQRYPAEKTYDAKGVPTVDCFLVGGPLNGRHGPIVGTAKVVELEIYAADGSVSSVELYELGAIGDLQGRYWAGTKGKQKCDLCKDWFAIGVVNDKGFCTECQADLIEVRRKLNTT